MNEFLTRLFFGRSNLINGMIAICIIASIALGCNCSKALDLGNISSSSNSSNTSSNSGPDDSTVESNGQVPSISTSESMVHDLTADFARAVETNNFSEIYENASTDFQSTYTEDQMRNAFKVFVDKKRLVKPVLDKTITMTPDFTPSPYVRTEQGLSILVL